jgi:hypothetical protein
MQKLSIFLMKSDDNCRGLLVRSHIHPLSHKYIISSESLRGIISVKKFLMPYVARLMRAAAGYAGTKRSRRCALSKMLSFQFIPGDNYCLFLTSRAVIRLMSLVRALPTSFHLGCLPGHFQRIRSHMCPLVVINATGIALTCMTLI